MNLEIISKAKTYLSDRVVKTPMLELSSSKIDRLLKDFASAKIKLELFQHTGSFKSRGVLLKIHSLTQAQRRKGVIAVSAGNHALAVAWGSKKNKINAKVLMPMSADSYRINGCKELGATVTLVKNADEGFKLLNLAAEQENRQIIHPFEDDQMILGAATCGLEIIEAMPEMDIIVVPVGGGGLLAGISLCLKLVKPTVQVYGVEPYGADSIFQSLSCGRPISLDKVDTIADSLGAPIALPTSFNIISKNVDRVVRITENEMISAMKIFRDKLNLFVEPACAASFAALIGPLASIAAGKNVALIACGSNISYKKYDLIINTLK